jgi:hypothetical protein
MNASLRPVLLDRVDLVAKSCHALELVVHAAELVEPADYARKVVVVPAEALP